MLVSKALEQLGYQILDIDGDVVVAKIKKAKPKYIITKEFEVPDAQPVSFSYKYLVLDGYIIDTVKKTVYKGIPDTPFYIEEQIYTDTSNKLKSLAQSNELLDKTIFRYNLLPDNVETWNDLVSFMAGKSMSFIIEINVNLNKALKNWSSTVKEGSDVLNLE